MTAIPYIVPLFLGMTFDARTSKPGVSIFDESVLSQAVKTDLHITTTSYKVVSDKSEIREQLDISGDLALKIKTGNIDVKGVGSYIKNEENNKNSVIVLSTLRYIANSMSLPDGAKPRDTWLTDFDKEVLGTHYVDTITYGVEMVAAIKFTANKQEDLNQIKADVKLALGSDNQTWTVEAAGKLDSLVSKTKDSSKLEITFFGTLPLTTIPNTIDGLKKLINNFMDLVKEAKLEEGLPMSFTILELNTIEGAEDVPEFQYLPDVDVEDEYDRFIDKFDDLASYRNRLYSWTRSLPYDLDETDSLRIGELLEKLNGYLNTCYKLMEDADLSKDPDQFTSILGEDLEITFFQIENLMTEIDKKVNRDLHVTSATYVRWGNTDCNENDGKARRLLEGYTIGSTAEGVGGFVRYDCMPYANVASPYTLTSHEEKSIITGIRYGTLGSAKNKLFKGDGVKKIKEDSVVPCAKCHQLDASTVSTFPAATKCPRSWELKYTGYLMSPSTSESHSAQYICVDAYPTDPTIISRAVTDKENTIDLALVRNGKSLPSKFGEREIVPCAVCALKGGRIL